VYDGALRAANSPETAIALADIASRALDALPTEIVPPLYRSTLRDVAHARIAALPAPKGADANRALLSELERQQCDDAKLLARTWRAMGGETEFDARVRAATERYLASSERGKRHGACRKARSGRVREARENVQRHREEACAKRMGGIAPSAFQRSRRDCSAAEKLRPILSLRNSANSRKRSSATRYANPPDVACGTGTRPPNPTGCVFTQAVENHAEMRTEHRKE
jgi:hypothetical protein